MTMNTPTLSGKANFQKLFQDGRSLVSRELVLYFITNQQSGNLVAFCVGKSIGNAVERNLVKRRLREAYRKTKVPILPGYTLAWVARNKIKDLPFQQIIQKMDYLITKAGIVNNHKEE